MGTLFLRKAVDIIPSVFDYFLRPLNEWFDEGNGNFPGRAMNNPAVNITENKKDYLVSKAVPDMKKVDFKIDQEGNMLTISTEKEETKEEKEKRFTRKERLMICFTSLFFITHIKIDQTGLPAFIKPNNLSASFFVHKAVPGLRVAAVPHATPYFTASARLLPEDK